MRLSPEDLASEKTAFLSLKMFERQVKPHYVRAFNEIKEYYLKKNPLGKIQFHSCGAIPEPFMRGLIESGVDGYDSLPPKVARHSNPAAKKRQLGKEMFFYGGIDVQETLPWGSVEDVRREVRQRIWEMGHGGGYLLSSSHRLEHDVPTQNVLAMIDEARNLRRVSLAERNHRQAPTLARVMNLGQESANAEDVLTATLREQLDCFFLVECDMPLIIETEKEWDLEDLQYDFEDSLETDRWTDAPQEIKELFHEIEWNIIDGEHEETSGFDSSSIGSGNFAEDACCRPYGDRNR